MRLVQQYKHVIFFVGFLMVLQSCSNDKSQLLVRQWKLADIKQSSEVPAEMKDGIDKSVKALKDDMLLTYYADGTYSTQFHGEEIKGKWKLNMNSTTLTSKQDGGQPQEWDIKELTAKSFICETNLGKGIITYVWQSVK